MRMFRDWSTIAESNMLILEGDDSVMKSWYPFYNPSLWKGINAIDDNTDGFTLLLSDGSMSLYRIDR